MDQLRSKQAGGSQCSGKCLYDRARTQTPHPRARVHTHTPHTTHHTHTHTQCVSKRQQRDFCTAHPTCISCAFLGSRIFPKSTCSIGTGGARDLFKVCSSVSYSISVRQFFGLDKKNGNLGESGLAWENVDDARGVCMLWLRGVVMPPPMCREGGGGAIGPLAVAGEDTLSRAL
jgi:hypothetical protein